MSELPMLFSCRFANAIEVLYCTIIFCILITSSIIFSAHGQERDGVRGGLVSTGEQIETEPKINDRNLKAELVFEGTIAPSNMAFLADNDILLMELTNGTVFRITNGVLQTEPILDVNYSRADGERGMLGISVSKSSPGHTYIFLYYTEADKDDGTPIGNRLYRYEFIDDKLVNSKLILDLPVYPGPYHNGGAITVGPDANVYVPIGNLEDVNAEIGTFPVTQTQNFEDGKKPDGSGGILRVTQDGKPVDDGILGNEYPLNLYYAYGIRNSFGIGFDPVTGNLWDTENGPNYGDEINLVEPGFNSGFREVQGIWYDEDGNIGNLIEGVPRGLVDFDGKGKYSDPELTWKSSVGLTALKFLNSSTLGEEYTNDMFVGDVHNGNLYHFDLDENRTQIILDGPAADKVVNSKEELDNAILGHFTGGITDLEVGEDGYLYVVSGLVGSSYEGKIYRLVSSSD